MSTNVIVSGGAFAIHVTSRGMALLYKRRGSPMQISCLSMPRFWRPKRFRRIRGRVTPIQVTSRVLETRRHRTWRRRQAATLSGSLNHTGASCTFDGNARPPIVDGHMYCQSPAEEMADASLSSATALYHCAARYHWKWQSSNLPSSTPSSRRWLPLVFQPRLP